MKKLQQKYRRCVADNIERSDDKERVIEEDGGVLLVSFVLEPLAKTDPGDQEQRRRKQIPGTRQQVRGTRDARGAERQQGPAPPKTHPPQQRQPRHNMLRSRPPDRQRTLTPTCQW